MYVSIFMEALVQSPIYDRSFWQLSEWSVAKRWPRRHGAAAARRAPCAPTPLRRRRLGPGSPRSLSPLRHFDASVCVILQHLHRRVPDLWNRPFMTIDNPAPCIFQVAFRPVQAVLSLWAFFRRFGRSSRVYLCCRFGVVYICAVQTITGLSVRWSRRIFIIDGFSTKVSEILHSANDGRDVGPPRRGARLGDTLWNVVGERRILTACKNFPFLAGASPALLRSDMIFIYILSFLSCL